MAARQPDRARDDAEQAVVERAKRDAAAFEELYDRYFPRIYRFVYSRVGDRNAVEDVTSEVFLKALRSIHRYQDRGSPFGAWLYRIAIHALVDRHRADRPVEDIDRLVERAADGPALEELAAARDELRRLWTAVEELPSKQRMAMILRFQEDMKIDEIAAAMETSPAAVKGLLQRGLSTVRRQVRG